MAAPRKPRKPPEGYVGIDRAGELLGVGNRTLHRWRREGKGPACIRQSGLLCYLPADIEKHLAEKHANDPRFGTAARASKRSSRPDIRIPKRTSGRRIPAQREGDAA